MSNLVERTIKEISGLLAAREITSTELTRACLDRIEATEHLGAYLHVARDSALEQAAQSAQGYFSDPRYSDDLCGADSGELLASLRRHGCSPAQIGRDRDVGQAQHG